MLLLKFKNNYELSIFEIVRWRKHDTWIGVTTTIIEIG